MVGRTVDTKGLGLAPLEEQIAVAKIEAAKALKFSGLSLNLAIFHDNFSHTVRKPDGTKGYCSSVMIVKSIGTEVSISGEGLGRTATAFPVVEASCEKCSKTAVFRVIQGKWDVALLS